jgi:hypothetical protein
MNVIGVPSPGQRSLKPTGQARARWRAPALAGAAAFWLANLAISVTPVAATYRSALGISYLPMLLEAAVGGLVLGGAVAFLLVRYEARIPGASALSKAVLLGAVALVLVTVGLELPSKLGSGVDEPARWLLVATVFNAIRILALAVAVGLVAGHGSSRHTPHRGRTWTETRT